MFEYMFGIDNIVLIDLWLDFGAIIITRLFLDAFHSEAIVFLLVIPTITYYCTDFDDSIVLEA